MAISPMETSVKHSLAEKDELYVPFILIEGAIKAYAILGKMIYMKHRVRRDAESCVSSHPFDAAHNL